MYLAHLIIRLIMIKATLNLALTRSRRSMMNKTLHKQATRGVADHGWLNSRHTFSFGNYYEPARMGFGLLRVINDDVVRPAMGFGTHPHDNMEIISIPLKGELRHQDSMGNAQHIKAGEVQIMSAGSGLTHSEYNGSDSDDVNFLQIWVQPKALNIEPRYQQKMFPASERTNRLDTVVSPQRDGEGIWINQDAWFSLGSFTSGETLKYSLHNENNGIYIFIIEGTVELLDEQLRRRDGLAVEGITSIELKTIIDSEFLIIEVPMQ